ncbi:LacI family DNA-binding transcriptional regulator [Micromonospora sp. WMMD1102]|uniref:LacI family DNA-binding transcriptional regulator n=1 Tax=Micromonospora sp. WMMD1102 TaxID=3016105 RepID=UPI002415845B|nr:LacI family DNA-binding transcriptional regulator [Micromonospora sp. WMMD1102]MDG4785645.1 LacI family DNA-binding transcriptional regulator [Micromonospora sp. WMMD1102]
MTAPDRSRTRRTRPRPTMDDVAAVAGVSRGTVSRVLNGGHNVSGPALEAVRRAIRKTGYVLNQHARSLVTQRSDSVAFILSEPQDRLFEDPNFNILLRGCTQELAEHDITLLLTIAGTSEDRKRVGRYVTAGHVDGALVISTHAGSPLLDELDARGLPFVAVGRPLGWDREVSYVAADDRGGARQMVSYLRSRGHRTIGTITGPLDTSGGVDRLAGYHDVLGETDPRLVVAGDYTSDGGEAAMERLLRQAPELDAVFVSSDLMATGAIAALHRAGRRVPEDVAVGGFDDSKVASTSVPRLTTIRQPWARISAEMVRLLLGHLAGDSHAAVILPTELVVRESA